MSPRDAGRDWVRWHEDYADVSSPLASRLREVQARIRAAVGPDPRPGYRIVAMCAGQGDDLLGGLDGHPAAARLSVRLVELDPVNADVLRKRIATAGWPWEVIEGDAADPTLYAGAVPADLVLVCGVFGNVSDADVMGTVAALPAFCRPEATVIWTRHRNEPDLTPAVRAAFADAGFDELAFTAPRDVHWGVGVHRRRPDATEVTMPTRSLFRFTR